MVLQASKAERCGRGDACRWNEYAHLNAIGGRSRNEWGQNQQRAIGHMEDKGRKIAVSANLKDVQAE